MYTFRNKVGKVPSMTFQVPSALTSLPILETNALIFKRASGKAWPLNKNFNISADLHSSTDVQVVWSVAQLVVTITITVPLTTNFLLTTVY